MMALSAFRWTSSGFSLPEEVEYNENEDTELELGRVDLLGRLDMAGVTGSPASKGGRSARASDLEISGGVWGGVFCLCRCRYLPPWSSSSSDIDAAAPAPFRRAKDRCVSE